jgi:hypothetical protein
MPPVNEALPAKPGLYTLEAAAVLLLDPDPNSTGRTATARGPAPGSGASPSLYGCSMEKGGAEGRLW